MDEPPQSFADFIQEAKRRYPNALRAFWPRPEELGGLLVSDRLLTADEQREHQMRAAGIAGAMITIVNEALTTQIRVMLQVPVDATAIMNLLIEHVCKIAALIPDQKVCAEIIREISDRLPMIVEKHRTLNQTTQGGVYIPKPGERPN